MPRKNCQRIQECTWCVLCSVPVSGLCLLLPCRRIIQNFSRIFYFECGDHDAREAVDLKWFSLRRLITPLPTSQTIQMLVVTHERPRTAFRYPGADAAPFYLGAVTRVHVQLPMHIPCRTQHPVSKMTGASSTPTSNNRSNPSETIFLSTSLVKECSAHTLSVSSTSVVSTCATRPALYALDRGEERERLLGQGARGCFSTTTCV